MSSHLTLPLSSSSQGVPIVITAITHPAQIVHQAHATLHDFITLWVVNYHTTDIKVVTVVTPTGGASSGTSPISSSTIIPPDSGKILLEPAPLLTGSNELKIYASVANVSTFTGYIYRRDQS